jgi:TIR domain-containing protein/SIR2-like protein
MADLADLQEGFWDNLLDYIQDRTVVPVIGPELVTVREGDQEVPLYRWVAQRLAADLALPIAELPQGFDLDDVVSLHLRRRGEREELYPQIHRMLRKAALTPAEPLRALAGIPGFDLFVSLTFDSLLADAIGAARPGGGPHAEQIAYSPNAVRDLPCPKRELRQPVVFHLLGRASASPDFAICDEDLLEFLHAMQDKQRQPKVLFDELRGNHLLILGCSFGDWLARFFLRTARSLELSQKRRRWDVLVGGRMAQEGKLALFLESFSSDTRVVPLTAVQFVTELARRWEAAHPAAAAGAEPEAQEAGTGGRKVPDGAIFVSYASEDLEAASRLVEGLRAAGLEVWFDKAALQLADDWARSIRRGIERCSLFLPVVSRQSLSEENRRRYFWREWNDADDFARGMAPGEAFIVPVVIDDTRIDRAPLPDSFKRAQGKGLPDGRVTPDVAELLRELVRDFHRRQRAA